jgi:hypothetical protein
MHCVKTERTEGRTRSEKHRRRRIWPRELAGMAEIRRQIASAQEGLCERKEKGAGEEWQGYL